ncbi:HvfC/BufC family peptide modification chaperone [Shewanella sp. MF05960]|uniref:HvfC/BufC family peptide modification chaperone n=1 Tax=Shewanella sp. MF05960 TaxID=3434874 RepID=UPI003D7996D8
MSRLAEIQQQFMAYLLSDETNNDHSTCQSAMQANVSQQAGISADIRLAIYANAYRIRLKETIETDHEILGRYLGDDLFDKMAADYTRAHPSANQSLRQFCDALPDFLQQDLFFKQHPIIADLARFERRLLNAFDAADSTSASFSDLQAISPELWPNCCLRFHPSVQIFTFNSNAVEAWQALKADSTPPAPDYLSTRAWLLWRGQTRLTEFASLTAAQHALLLGFIQGNNFAEQCEQMLEWHDEQSAPMMVLQTMQTWFQRGLIRAVVSS